VPPPRGGSRCAFGLRFCGLVFGSVCLLGCAHYSPRPINPQQTATELSARSLADEGLHQFLTRALPRQPMPWPLPQWNLEQLTLAADFFQPNLEVARAQWTVAKAGIVTAGQRPNPSISLSGTYDTTTPPPWIPAMSFDVPIETGGKRGYRLAQTQRLAEVAQWEVVDQVWQVRSAVRSALLDLYGARRSSQVLVRQEAAQALVVDLLEGQLSAGAVAANEVTQARIMLDTTRLDRQQAHRQEVEALAVLAAAIGVPVGALDNADFSFAGLDQFPTTFIAPEIRREAMLHRADVRSALANYAASQAALQLEIANQYPDIHLGPGYEYDQTDNKWTLGLGLTLPILNQNQGPIAEAKAKRQLAAAQFLAAQARAIGETDLALAACEAALEQSATAAGLLGRLQQRLDAVKAAQEAGEVDPLAMASAQVEYGHGALLHLDALIKAQQALGQLENTVQSPLVISDEVMLQATTNSRSAETSSHEP
jgi:outer membrane protein, heavy metal efflux system